MKLKVLVVEDESDFVELISFNLEQCGYHVLKAPMGEEGLEVARDAWLDLIVLDVMVPGIDGFSVCEILRGKAAGICYLEFQPTNRGPHLASVGSRLASARGRSDAFERSRFQPCVLDDSP